MCDKFMQVPQNRALDKFMQFIFMRSSILCIVMYDTIKNLCNTHLCNRRLTCIIYSRK